jgi:hypothetical protein
MTHTTDDIALGELKSTEVNAANGGLPAGLPMPRDPGLLTDISRRQRVSHFGPDRYPFPVIGVPTGSGRAKGPARWGLVAVWRVHDPRCVAAYR